MIFNEHIIKTKYNGYGGSERKMAVIMDDNNQYLLKFPDPIRDKDKTLSYINNSISEYISCHIFDIIGIPVQETKLGEYIDQNGKVKIVCACKDVREPYEDLCEFGYILSGINTDDNEKRKLTFEYMEEVFDSIPQDIPKEELSAFYYDMFVVDALIGNTDRHNGNWGILQSFTGARISPVYDCGSSLAPLVDENLMCDESGKRCAITANSALIGSNGKRIRYFDFFQQELSQKIQDALKRVMPNVNLDDIDNLIRRTEYISSARQEFYRSFLHTSYERILLPALERSLSHDLVVNENILDHKKCYDVYKNIIQTLKNNAAYERRSLSEYGFPDIEYTKAGDSHIMVYKNGDLQCMLSSRSNDRDTRINYVKLNELGISLESWKDKKQL